MAPCDRFGDRVLVEPVESLLGAVVGLLPRKAGSDLVGPVVGRYEGVRLVCERAGPVVRFSEAPDLVDVGALTVSLVSFLFSANTVEAVEVDGPLSDTSVELLADLAAIKLFVAITKSNLLTSASRVWSHGWVLHRLGHVHRLLGLVDFLELNRVLVKAADSFAARSARSLPLSDGLRVQAQLLGASPVFDDISAGLAGSGVAVRGSLNPLRVERYAVSDEVWHRWYPHRYVERLCGLSADGWVSDNVSWVLDDRFVEVWAGRKKFWVSRRSWRRSAELEAGSDLCERFKRAFVEATCSPVEVVWVPVRFSDRGVWRDNVWGSGDVNWSSFEFCFDSEDPNVVFLKTVVPANLDEVLVSHRFFVADVYGPSLFSGLPDRVPAGV